MHQQSPGERLRASFASDLKRLNALLDAGRGVEARDLARRLAPHAHLVGAGERTEELYGKLTTIAGCARFALRVERPAA